MDNPENIIIGKTILLYGIADSNKINVYAKFLDKMNEVLCDFQTASQKFEVIRNSIKSSYNVACNMVKMRINQSKKTN